MNNKKQCVSVRLKPSDLEKIERVADRLGVRNSDVIRYAIKTAITRLMDLHDHSIAGHRLLPMFLSQCNELNRHFDLDADRLDEIINEHITEETEKVERMDIELLALCGLSPHYIQSRLQEITGQTAEPEEIPQVLNQYLIDKYKNRLASDETVDGHSLQ